MELKSSNNELVLMFLNKKKKVETEILGSSISQ